MAASAAAAAFVRQLVLPVMAPDPPYQAGRRDPAGSSSGAPGVLAPHLAAGQHLAAVPVPPAGTVSATDNAGNLLSSYGDAGLSYIGTRLGAHAPTRAGAPGLSVRSRTPPANQGVAGSQAVIIQPGASQVATTISPQAEQAARAAVGTAEGSALVALQPATGNILAIANNAQFNDFALTAAVAPGSVCMKIITASALIDSGLASEQPGRVPAGVHGDGRHLPQQRRRVRAGRHAAVHRLRAVLQQRVRPVVAAPVREAGVHRADVLRP